MGNPFEDYNPIFTYYKSSEPIITTVEDPLFGKLNLEEGFRLNPSTGNYIAPANTPKNEEFQTDYLNRMAETHSEPSTIETSITETVPTSYSIKQDLNGNKKKAIEFFKSKKDSNGKQILTDYQIAGIVGNLIGESKLNAKAVNPTSGAFGYAQWLGDRKKKLFAKYGNNPTEEQQLEFIWEELNTSERRAFEELLQTKTVDGAINSFMRHFERPSKKEMASSISARLKYGRSLLS